MAAAVVCGREAHAQEQAPAPGADQPQVDTADVSATPALTSSRIKAKIDEVEARKDLDAAPRDQALALYRKALAALEAAESNREAAAEFQKTIEESPKKTDSIKKQLDSLQSSAGPKIAGLQSAIGAMSLGDVEQQLTTAQGESAKLGSELTRLDTALRDIASRSTTARAEQTDEQKKLDALAEASTADEEDSSSPVVDAKRASIAAERLVRSSKINLLEQEVISLPARKALISASRDLVAAQLEELQKQIPLLEGRANELRKSDAVAKQAESERVTRELSDKHPILQAYAKATSDLHERRTALTRFIEKAQRDQAVISADIAQLKETLASAQQILEIGSVGSDLGEYLREMRDQLPILSKLRDRIRDRDEDIVEARLQRLNVEQRRRALLDPELAGKRVLSEGGLDTDKDWNELRPKLEELMAARREALAQLSETRALEIEQLAKLNAANRELKSHTEQLQELLSSRLLWLPTSAPLGRTWWDQIRTAVDWLSTGESWKRTAQALWGRTQNAPLLTALVLLACSLILLFRRRLVLRLNEIANAVGKVSKDNFLLTPRALIITTVISLPLPLLMGYAGRLLARPPTELEFAATVGSGLVSAAIVLFVIRFVQNLCIPSGLLRAHFEWRDRECQGISRNLHRLAFVITPIAFLLGMIDASNSQTYRDGLGRLAFIVGAIALSLFVFRIVSPRKRPVASRLSPEGALWLTRGIWYPVLGAAPLALAALSVFGYYDSATQLQTRLAVTIAIVFLGLLAYAVGIRELLVARRRLEVVRAQERRKKASETAAVIAETKSSGDASPHVIDDSEIDVASISEQTRNLLGMLTLVGIGVGLWLTWKSLLPALGLLDEISLWTQTITTDAGTKVVPVTLFNFLIGIAIGVLTLVAARNLPGLLEFTLLQRMAIEPGTRYAITSISRYCIITIGIVIAFQSIGADWSQLQWIIAALGVGVGFGLQEIVANFISGLIILFERPIRVGDTVTIGDVSGTVSRIQIRATSITDWDNREILVPNKSLITDRVTNWTLSEPVTRLLFNVGVAYGTDTDRVQEIMLAVIRANPLALEVPPPSVLFMGFGDSSLDFEVRVFVAQPNQRLRALHELHTGIYRALNANGIEIPFPQRDLHLKLRDVADSVEAGQSRLQPRTRHEAAE